MSPPTPRTASTPDSPWSAGTATRETLGRGACLALLAPGGDGRVAATMRAVPVIIPVVFTLLGEDVVFSPGPGAGLTRAVANSVVAFEADYVGVGGPARWSVQVTGVARTHTGHHDPPEFRLSSEIMSGWRAGG